MLVIDSSFVPLNTVYGVCDLFAWLRANTPQSALVFPGMVQPSPPGAIDSRTARIAIYGSERSTGIAVGTGWWK